MFSDVIGKSLLIQSAITATTKAIVITQEDSLTPEEWRVVEDKLDEIARVGKSLTSYVKDILTNK